MSMTVDRVVDSTSGITRSQRLRYYESVAALLMPHLRGRPVAFVRAPAAWSARARPGMPISVPLDWSELPGLRSPTEWTVAQCGERVAIGNTPWEGYWHCSQNLHEVVRKFASANAARSDRGPTFASGTAPR